MDMNSMKANAAALEGGEWMDDLDGFGDFKVLIKPFDHPEADLYHQELTRLIIGRKATRKDKTVPPTVRDYVACKVLIDKCVLDWENWQEKGVDVPYSKKKLEEFLLKPAPEGMKIGRHMKMTPDKKTFNYEGKFLYSALLSASLRVGVLDDEDDDGEHDGDAEKNASRDGSAADADSAAA